MLRDTADTEQDKLQHPSNSEQLMAHAAGPPARALHMARGSKYPYNRAA